jgi:Tol biopolymer transport system component
MAPEQTEGHPVDARADLFALGCVLYEMLSGSAPFVRSSWDETREAIRNEAPRAFEPAVPGALAKVVLRCLEKDPSRRPASAAEVRGELVRVLAELEGTPRRHEPARSRVWSKRAVLVAAVAGALGWALTRTDTAPEPGPALLTLRRLTANPPENVVLSAAVAPDGRSVAFADRAGLHVRVLDPPATRELPAPPGIVDSIAWFPDGRRLAVAARGERQRHADLWVVTIRDGTFAQVASEADSPSVAPSGRAIVYANRRGLWSVQADGTRARPLIAGGQDALLKPVFSPEGTRVAFVRLPPSETQRVAMVESVALDGSDRIELYRSGRLVQNAGALGLAWTDARELSFALGPGDARDTGSDVWSLSVDASGRPRGQPCRRSEWADVTVDSLSASVDGRRLAFVNTQAHLDVHVGALEEGGGRLGPLQRLTSEQTDEVSSSFGPGGQVLFSSTRDEGFDVFARGPGSAERAIAPSRSWETWPVLAPGDREVLHWALVGRSRTLTLRSVPLTGGPARTIWQTSSTAPERSMGRPPPRSMHFRCGATGCVLAERSGQDQLPRPAGEDPRLAVIDAAGPTGAAQGPRGIALAAPTALPRHMARSQDSRGSADGGGSAGASGLTGHPHDARCAGAGSGACVCRRESRQISMALAAGPTRNRA